VRAFPITLNPIWKLIRGAVLASDNRASNLQSPNHVRFTQLRPRKRVLAKGYVRFTPESGHSSVGAAAAVYQKLSELMLADKPRLGVGLGVINFFPRAVHKRPSAGVTDDCRHAAVVAIVRFVHFRSKLEGVGSLFSGYRHSKRKQRLSLIFVPISRFARFISITIKQFNVIG
jgi:hypothetical protein